MWPAWVVAAIALAAATFMLRFLIALLREGAPTVCYWIVPVPGRPEKECHLRVLSSIYADEDCCASEDRREDRRSDYYELLENENHAQDKSDSSLVALDVPRVSDRLGWRSIHSRRGYISREHRL
jgi:hypothetical protein